MSIKGLTALISEHAPKAIRNPFGRRVTINASMSTYQSLIAMRQKDGKILTSNAGETTSHPIGFFNRNIRMVENGIKPAYVFYGKPPELKAGVPENWLERREETKAEGKEEKETGTAEEVDWFSRRTVKVTWEHNKECRRLLKLIGIAAVIAPSEAEAQCVELARGSKVYAAGSEGMDTLIFNTPIPCRHLAVSEAIMGPISEMNMQLALEGPHMDMSQFIELYILLGFDYLKPIKGIGPKSVLRLLREYGSLGGVVQHLRPMQADKEDAAADEEDEKKRGDDVKVPDQWLWEEAKKTFEQPEVTPSDQIEIEWETPDVGDLLDLLVKEKGFNEERVRRRTEACQVPYVTK